MNATLKLVVVALALTPLAAVAQGTQKLSCIKDMVFSQEFLQRYPNAGAACREVIMKEGQKWARFDAEIVKVKGDQVTAKFLGSGQNAVSTVTFIAAPDARVQMDGKDVKVSSLRAGDTLSFWVPENRAGFYAAPGAATARKLAVVSSTAKQE